jgi:hypothetical protein
VKDVEANGRKERRNHNVPKTQCLIQNINQSGATKSEIYQSILFYSTHCLLYENTTHMHGQWVGVLLSAVALKAFSYNSLKGKTITIF